MNYYKKNFHLLNTKVNRRLFPLQEEEQTNICEQQKTLKLSEILNNCLLTLLLFECHWWQRVYASMLELLHSDLQMQSNRTLISVLSSLQDWRLYHQWLTFSRAKCEDLCAEKSSSLFFALSASCCRLHSPLRCFKYQNRQSLTWLWTSLWHYRRII